MKPQAPAGTTTLSPGLRRYLYFTAAVTGAAIMIVEILGAKILAPYFGTSHFVWTAQIVVTLAALAAGYYLGGRVVDNSLRLGRIYWAILAAAVYLALVTIVLQPLAWWCLEFNLAFGSLLASAILFFVPLALLAMVGPFFVRALTETVAAVGGNAGRLTAVSTLGSLAGTILMGYVLIPLFANSVTLFATSATLMAVAAGYLLIWGRKETPMTVVGAAVILGTLLGGIGVARDRPVGGLQWREVFRANSNFGQLQVISARNNTLRFYLNDFLEQNSYDTVRRDGNDAFTYLLHGLAVGYAGKADDILCIGLGAGIVPMKFSREGARVDVVEINPAAVAVAEEFFDFEPFRIHLAVDDGRHFLNRCENRYDAIIMDAFLGDSSPSHLMSREAFAAMQHRLKPGGVLVINSFGKLEDRRDFLAASLERTLRDVFRNVRIHAAGVNVYFVASDQPEMNLRPFPDLLAVPGGCRDEVRLAYDTVATTNPRHGIVLTDDFNPVDYYDAANREAIRRAVARKLRLP